MLRPFGFIFGLFICLHGAAIAQDSSAQNAAPLPAVATNPTGPAQYGTGIDGDGLVFVSGTTLTVPSAPGGVAPEGPAAGSDSLSFSSSEPAPYRESVP